MTDLSKFRVPAFCPLCSYVMKGKSSSSYHRHGVCINCEIYFVEGREKRWESGWRPSQEELEAYKSSLSSSGS